MPRIPGIHKVLLIGSGPIVIGQAAEFDYAGTQACRALREEGVTSVLVNSNPATIMTDEGQADVTYIEPLTVEVLQRIIARERPCGLLGTLGGQTGLNLSVALHERGVLQELGVRLLGTSVESIKAAEDREQFKQLLLRLGEPVPPSCTVGTVEQGLQAAQEIGLPVVVRPAFTLGGSGGGVAWTSEQLGAVIAAGLAASPVAQVLIEQYLLGFKEVEYEVLRDAGDTCITVCNMENFDPVGVHTGDSIVVAPSQTLSDREYHQLRAAALRIVRALAVEGGCNVQFALDPRSGRYFVIEVNPRVSRSSALASKATGYPIARVATQVALGYRLHEIKNAVTGRTSAAFEPALDYVVVKIPRWPFDKFPGADRSLGTQMKATGEVMAIDRTFEAALHKALRSLELKPDAVAAPGSDPQAALALTSAATDQRLWHLLAALRRACAAGASEAALAELHKSTGIDLWFLTKLRRIVRMEAELTARGASLDEPLLRAAKRMGFGDAQLAQLCQRSEAEIRELRARFSVQPVFKTVDTCAGEFAAQTPYFYSTYETQNEAAPLPGPKKVVLGSGPIRIGQGIEFDYCSVRGAMALREAGERSILINSNPETVSTDFDLSDRLYFEPLDEESVLAVLDNERRGAAPGEPAPAVLVQFGGQTALNLAGRLAARQIPVLGTTPDRIDLAEDRQRFDTLMAELGIPRPRGALVRSGEEALAAAAALGFPLVVRPSYVLGGRAMEIVRSEAALRRYVERAQQQCGDRPLLIDRYLRGIEIEVDAICDGEQVLIPGIMRHIERAGVHSGDSFAVYPALGVRDEDLAVVVELTTRLARALGVIGLLNIQFVITEPPAAGSEQGSAGGPVPPTVLVLEANPRASRTVPFLSKVTGVPMVTVATRVMLGATLHELGYAGGLWPTAPLVAIKAPVFSMGKLRGADTALGPEMKSTGEVMGIDFSYRAALQKALLAAGIALPAVGAAFLSIADHDKPEALPIAQALAAHGYTFYATSGTAAWLHAHGLAAQAVRRISDGGSRIPELIRGRQVALAINTITGGNERIRESGELHDGMLIRRSAVESGVPCFTSLDTARVVVEMLAAPAEYELRPVGEYRQGRPAVASAKESP